MQLLCYLTITSSCIIVFEDFLNFFFFSLYFFICSRKWQFHHAQATNAQHQAPSDAKGGMVESAC